MLGQQPVEFLAHRCERSGLDLDEEVLAADVDDETVERHFETIAGEGVVVLQRGMQRTLVERADVGLGLELGFRCDPSIVT